jgi:hypothetical protein
MVKFLVSASELARRNRNIIVTDIVNTRTSRGGKNIVIDDVNPNRSSRVVARSARRPSGRVRPRSFSSNIIIVDMIPN